ncbi:hypothetical protein P3S68_030055 [Capsicum galapagoense]
MDQLQITKKKARVQIDSEELPKQSQLGKNESEESDNSSSPIEREIISKSHHYSVKTIGIDIFRVVMPMNSPNAVFGDLVLKCQLGKPFDKLRSIMKNENIDGLFKKSFFAYFLELSEDHTLYFPMSMIDEVWINYSGMSVYFGLKEFAIVMGLRCDSPEEPLIKETPYKGPNKCKGKKDGLLGIVGHSSYKAANLMADLEDKDIPKHCREKLFLVLFVHSVLLARDVKKVIEDDLLVFADDFDKFNDYP